MKTNWRSILLSVVLAISVILPVWAQGGITVINTGHQATFAEQIVFRITAESDSPINDIVLFYTVLGGKEAKNLAYPEFEPATRVDTEWTWHLEQGMLPPGTKIEYYWQLKDEAGHELTTDPVTLTYEDTRFDWQHISEGNITVYWYDENESYASNILAAAVRALGVLENQVGVTLEQEVKIFAYNSKSDMSLALARKSETFDAQVTTLGQASSEDTLLLLGTAPGVEETVAHELSHLVVGLATDNPYRDLPRWLDEGLAMYAEGGLPHSFQVALDTAIKRDELISVRSLAGYTGDPSQINLFYAESYSIVSFLLDEYGREAMAELLAAFKTGDSDEEALQQVYGLGVDELDNAWRASLGLEPREIVPTPTPLAIPTRPPMGLPTAPPPGGETPTAPPPPTAAPAPTTSPPPTGFLPCCGGLGAGAALLGLFWLFKPRAGGGVT